MINLANINPTCFDCAIDRLSIRLLAGEKVLTVDILSAMVKILRAAKSIHRLLNPTNDLVCSMAFRLTAQLVYIQSPKMYIYNSPGIYTIAEIVSISEFQEKMTVKVDL